MTPGYGFAYFRWRVLLWGDRFDETKPVPTWRYFDQDCFAYMQIKAKASKP